jgi:hypothetical protein
MMNDVQLANFIDAALRNSDKVTIVLQRKKLGKSMMIFDHTNNKNLGSAFLYNTGKLRKWIPAKQITGTLVKQLITRK